MTYDENVFKEKANRKARKIWIVFAVLLSANYGSDASGGLYPTTSYLIFLALCWLPLIFGEVLLRVKAGQRSSTATIWSSVTASSTLLSSVLQLPRSLSPISCR